jgi:hypothetical protein
VTGRVENRIMSSISVENVNFESDNLGQAFKTGTFVEMRDEW